MASLQEGGRAGQGRWSGIVPYVVPIGRYLTFDNNSQEAQSQTCATTFLTSWGVGMYLAVVRSNRISCGQARGGT